MTASEFLTIVAASLLLWGVLTAWAAKRLGRDPWTWWILGTFLGPLSVAPLLALTLGDRGKPAASRRVGASSAWRGRTEGGGILIVATRAALLPAAAIAAGRHLGWICSRTTLATVAGADASLAQHGDLTDDAGSKTGAYDRLGRAERALPQPAAEHRVLFGPFVPAVASELRGGRYELAVAGRRPRRMDARQVARLALASPCPLLVTSCDDDRDTRALRDVRDR